MNNLSLNVLLPVFSLLVLGGCVTLYQPPPVPGDGALSERLWSLRTSAPVFEPDGCVGITAEWIGGASRRPETRSVRVRAYSQATGDTRNVTLRRNGVAPTLYAADGCMALATDAARADALTVAEGDILAFVLVPQRPDAIALAAVRGGVSEGRYSFTIDPNLVPAEMADAVAAAEEAVAPVAAMVTPAGAVSFFAETQVIVRVNTEAELFDFLERRGGRVLTKMTMPIPEGAQSGASAGEASYYLVELDASGVGTDGLSALMERFGVEGEVAFSSEAAAGLVTLIAEEQAAGRAVLPHALLIPSDQPVSVEGTAAAPANWFTASVWYRRDGGLRDRVRAADALMLLEILDARQNAQVPVAIIDGGFASPADFAAAGIGAFNHPDYDTPPGGAVVPFAAIPQCHMNPVGVPDCTPGAAGGVHVFPCSGAGGCPFHGTQMMSLAVSEIDNGFGAAGSGAHTATPILIEYDIPYLIPVTGGVLTSVTSGAHVINISSGVPCAIPIDVCEPLGNLTVTGLFAGACTILRGLIPGLGDFTCEQIWVLLSIPPQVSALETSLLVAEANNTVVVASAGNMLNIPGLPPVIAGPHDAGLVRLIPCTFPTVVCVGAIDVDPTGTDLAPSPISGFGAAVDIWAPDNATTTVTPASFPALTTAAGTATSGAAAFTSGVVANIFATSIPPGSPPGTPPMFTAAQARAILISSGCVGDGVTATCPSPVSPAPRTASITGTPGPRGVANINASAGGYIDAHEAVLLGLTTAGVATPGITMCTAGWDETTPATSADTPATAIPFGFTFSPAPSPGGMVTIDLSAPVRDASIHRYATASGRMDVDNFAIAMPTFATGAPEGRVTLTTPTLSLAAATPLDFSLRRGAAGPVLATGIANVPVMVGPMPPGDYIIEVSGPPDLTSDACYGGATLTLDLAIAPESDRFEPSESFDDPADLRALRWSHRGWVCQASSGRPGTAPCPDIFENGPAPRFAYSIWSLSIEDLALSRADDRDFYRIRIPDPTNAADDGHPDIRPAAERAAGGTPEPVKECGLVRREEFGPPALDNSISVSTAGELNIAVIPEANALSVDPVEPAREALRIYRGRSVDPALNAGPPLLKTITCPRSDPAVVRSGKDLRELVLSFGERPDARDLFVAGGYRIELEYKIEARRGIPSWVNDIGGIDRGALACLGVPSGISGAAGGFGGFSAFPFCFGDQRFVIDCIADGPGCWNIFVFNRPEIDAVIDLGISTDLGHLFVIFDELGRPLDAAGSFSALGEAFAPLLQQQTEFGEALTGAFDGLEDGAYVLRIPPGEAETLYLGVFGPSGVFDVSFPKFDAPDFDLDASFENNASARLQ